MKEREKTRRRSETEKEKKDRRTNISRRLVRLPPLTDGRVARLSRAPPTRPSRRGASPPRRRRAPPEMGKFGKRSLRRVPMTSKMGNKNFYKGRGARNEGTHTTLGAYVVRPERLLRIVAPTIDLARFPLRPYVHAAARAPARGARVPEYAPPGAAPPAQMK